MAIGSVEQRAGGTDFDAIATLRTVEPAAVSADDSAGAASSRFNRVLAHPFVADARAAFAENAALRIVSNDGREISFGIVILLFSETFFESTPVKGHLLQLTFTTAIADGTIKRMIGEQKLEHRALRFFNLVALSGDDHAVSADDGAGRLQLRHLLDSHETHAAGCLQRQIGVVTK